MVEGFRSGFIPPFPKPKSREEAGSHFLAVVLLITPIPFFLLTWNLTNREEINLKDSTYGDTGISWEAKEADDVCSSLGGLGV